MAAAEEPDPEEMKMLECCSSLGRGRGDKEEEEEGGDAAQRAGSWHDEDQEEGGGGGKKGVRLRHGHGLARAGRRGHATLASKVPQQHNQGTYYASCMRILILISPRSMQMQCMHLLLVHFIKF